MQIALKGLVERFYLQTWSNLKAHSGCDFKIAFLPKAFTR